MCLSKVPEMIEANFASFVCRAECFLPKTLFVKDPSYDLPLAIENDIIVHCGIFLNHS